MTRAILLLLPAMLLSTRPLDAHGHPTDFPREDDRDDDRPLETSWSLERLVEGNELDARRDRAVEKLRQVLGIRSHTERAARRKVPPQFMMELYKNVADPSGVTRGRNPYNAKVVRSFIERDTSMSRFYFFNITGLEANESVLEAELHLYRKKTPLKSMHPSTLASPYYLIRVYQVLDERSLDVPDLHRLLNVRYVGAHASGWQIFNVKQAVLGWLNGEPNLGLLVTASTLFEDRVIVEFSRRNEYHRSKQPILVLFDDDGSKEAGPGRKLLPRYYAYENEKENGDENEVAFLGETRPDDETSSPERTVDAEGDDDDGGGGRTEGRSTTRGQPEEARWESAGEPEFFQRRKRKRSSDLEEDREGEGRHVSPRKRSRRDARRPIPIPSSMDIYDRATRRQNLGETANRRRSPRSFRGRRSTATKSHATVRENVTECSRHELYVDFKEIGLSSSIIAPLGYSAYHCKGVCESPLSQDQQPTNHATIQGIVHKMGLVKDVERPCCVPTKLLGTTILFFDDNENVVLKVYQDMIADRCGCR